MASTYAGTANNEVLTRAAVVDGASTAAVTWKTTEPSGWAGSGRAVTWAEFHTHVVISAAAPNNSRCPSKESFEAQENVEPQETPGTPTLSVQAGGSLMTATWTNTSSAWAMQVEFDCTTGPFDGSVNRSATVTSAQYDPSSEYASPPGTQTYRARVRYTNAEGVGPWSAWSNTVAGVTW